MITQRIAIEPMRVRDLIDELSKLDDLAYVKIMKPNGSCRDVKRVARLDNSGCAYLVQHRK